MSDIGQKLWHDRVRKLVYIEFTETIRYVGYTPEQARALAWQLIHHADEAEQVIRSFAPQAFVGAFEKRRGVGISPNNRPGLGCAIDGCKEPVTHVLNGKFKSCRSHFKWVEEQAMKYDQVKLVPTET